MAEPPVDPPLSPEEVQELLSAGPAGILVGGMALAFWAQYYNVEPPNALAAGITSDIDFFGTRQDAEALAAALNQLFPDHVRVITPDFLRVTANSAKVLVDAFHGRRDPIEIDYLDQLHGYNRPDLERLRQRETTVTYAGVELGRATGFV